MPPRLNFRLETQIPGFRYHSDQSEASELCMAIFLAIKIELNRFGFRSTCLVSQA